MEKEITFQMLPIVTAFLYQSPVFTVWLIGFILAWQQRDRDPRKSVYVMTGTAIFMIVTLVDTILNIVLPSAMGYQNLGLFFGIKNFIASVARAVGWIFIMMALFKRNETPAVQNN